MEKIDSGHERPCRMIIRHVKNPLMCPFGLAAKILKLIFASSVIRCLPLRWKLGIKITCGNWYRLLYGAALDSDTSSWLGLQRRQIYRPISAKRNRRTTAQQVANQFLPASGKQISRKTLARRLRGGGLYARRRVVCVPLTRQHRTARLQWCREHHNSIEQDWACVLFSDESRFSLSSDCRRQLIWRESGTAYRPENIQERD
ncbi:transposable element Tcb2 transposase [Trichonephila clavipes]|nr:transposable element Tcb2 transposase [Trichonephila clavipes]